MRVSFRDDLIRFSEEASGIDFVMTAGAAADLVYKIQGALQNMGFGVSDEDFEAYRSKILEMIA